MFGVTITSSGAIHKVADLVDSRSGKFSVWPTKMLPLFWNVWDLTSSLVGITKTKRRTFDKLIISMSFSICIYAVSFIYVTYTYKYIIYYVLYIIYIIYIT